MSDNGNAPGGSPESRKVEAGDLASLVVELVDSLDAMVAYWDDNQVCRFVNHAYKAWFGRGRSELLGVSLRDLLGPALYAQNLTFIEAAYRGQRQVFERAIPAPDGSGVRHSLATYVPRIVNGKVVGMFVHVADVAPLKRLEEELRVEKNKAEALSGLDPLTGLPNRRTLDKKVDEAIAAARRSDQRIGLLTLDFDNFKSINDNYGHGEGDRFLIDMANRIAACMRDSDSVTRIGGDEFIVLATALERREDVEAIAERILQAIRLPVAVGSDTVSPGLSIGIAIFPEHGESIGALMAASDRALIEAKRTGRNRYVVA